MRYIGTKVIVFFIVLKLYNNNNNRDENHTKTSKSNRDKTQQKFHTHRA
jgi:hypothetical protein